MLEKWNEQQPGGKETQLCSRTRENCFAQVEGLCLSAEGDRKVGLFYKTSKIVV